jgi:hypothetical protein
MDESWLRLNGFVESLTPAQLTEPTDVAGWSVRDHLDHLRAWGKRDARGIPAAIAG